MGRHGGRKQNPSGLASSRCETGAVLVESALAGLLLLVLAAGILEYASLFTATIDVSSTVRSAARAGSATGTEPATDDRILQAISYKSGGRRNDIERVVVYRADAGTTAPPPGCLTNAYPQPAGLACNVYRAQDLSLGNAELSALPGAQGWPPSAREGRKDYLGVWVKVRRTPLMNLVWSPSQYEDHFVMRMDPPASSGTATAANPLWATTTTKTEASWVRWDLWYPPCTKYCDSPPKTDTSWNAGIDT